MNFKVEIIKSPTEKDWEWVKTCTLNTVGKKSLTAPTEEWKKKLILAEHSPLRELWFGIRMEIPYYVSVHYVRHHIGVNHYIQSQRNDRQKNYDRTKAPQDAMVSHIMSINAQELVFMSHKRLCSQADPFTRAVMKEIVRQVVEVCPEFKEVLVPLCEYRNGKCTEFYPCGRSAKGTSEKIFEKIFEVLCCFTTQGKSKEYNEGFIDCLAEVDERLQNLSKENYGAEV